MRKIKTLPLSHIYNNADNKTENENIVSLPENGDANESVSDNDKDFDQLLDDFIKSQLEEDEEKTETTCWSVQEEPYEPYPDDDKTEENENEAEDCSSDTDETNSEDDNYDDSDYDDEEEEEPIEPEPLTLDQMIGLTSVKNKLASYEKVVRFNKLRRDSGLPTPSIPLHAMVLGAPGTGKTTVAKMMGKMLAVEISIGRGVCSVNFKEISVCGGEVVFFNLLCVALFHRIFLTVDSQVVNSIFLIFLIN